MSAATPMHQHPADAADRPAPPTFAALVNERGYVILYRQHQPNHCPGCGRSAWLVGRHMAECGHCGTALPILSSTTGMHIAAADGASGDGQ